MRDLTRQLIRWYGTGVPFGLATVVATSGSALRGVGAVLAVDRRGNVLGGVSGGCVEGAVYEAASAAALYGTGDRMSFAAADSNPFAPSLTCGGEIDVLVESIDAQSKPHFSRLLTLVGSGAGVCEVSVTGEPAQPGHMVVTTDSTLGSTGWPDFDRIAAHTAREMLATGVSGIRSVGSIEMFFRTFAPRPRLIIFGGIDLADSVAEVASFVGYRVTVCDARPVFAAAARFPHAHEVVEAWPHDYLAEQWQAGLVHPSTALCVLTHDAKFDGPLLEVAVRTPASYIGVLGSRTTHDDRTERLCARGLDEEALRRLASPVGLDLGGRSPQETALSIVAEMVANSYGRDGGRLRDGSGAIHPDGMSKIGL